jgi:acetyl-CoA C-acetyltransferase
LIWPTDENATVVVAAVRTPIGRFLGGLSSLSAVEMGTHVVRHLLEGLPAELPIRHLVFGNARQAGSGPNPARQIAYAAGLGEACVAHTVNMACASGMEAILQGARLITLGEAEAVIAGGTESMSRLPYLLDGARTGYRLGHAQVVDAMYRDGFLCPLSGQLMGETAETLAERYGIGREEQDAYALESQRRAAAAWEAGRFRSEVVPVEVRERKETRLVERDEHPRPETTLEKLAKLPPVFRRDGTVTAGNASGITDGAAALLLVRAGTARRLGLPTLARLEASRAVGVDPRIMGIGPVPAVRELLEETGLDLGAMDLIELNEAFAAQVLAVDRELGLPRERLNVNGGAIALGHPIGATGARIVVTLLHEMVRRGAHRGLATLCVSGGLGMALTLVREEEGRRR